MTTVGTIGVGMLALVGAGVGIIGAGIIGVGTAGTIGAGMVALVGVGTTGVGMLVSVGAGTTGVGMAFMEIDIMEETTLITLEEEALIMEEIQALVVVIAHYQGALVLQAEIQEQIQDITPHVEVV
ncbi:hypothetical protein GCM10022257_19190 [Hyunsoonleella aestuarii]|uniref:Uncharacterized protein n=1 Tax=Hyunsoonleella aestuarii TaxID=912802 RepID=A0ABP8EC41_9FLAO